MNFCEELAGIETDGYFYIYYHIIIYFTIEFLSALYTHYREISSVLPTLMKVARLHVKRIGGWWRSISPLIEFRFGDM